MSRRGPRWTRGARDSFGETRSVRASLRRNTVALISLVLAITSLGYAAWRGETSEVQRNHREAAFRILVEVGELREAVLTRSFFVGRVEDPSTTAVPDPATWIMGWGKVMMIRDLSTVLPEPLPDRGRQLFESWQSAAGRLHAQDRETRQQATDDLLERIDRIRDATVQLIHDLG
ncbi:hypothetical protein [Halomonas denitrificans]|nr:hypothetical protein [Halomonas denitrificans]